MPITYNSGTNTITVEYISGDAKGNSTANPYKFADIYDADLAGSWGVFHKYEKHYITNAGIKITGNLTYFYDWNCSIDFVIPSTPKVTCFYTVNGANVLLGYTSRNVSYGIYFNFRSLSTNFGAGTNFKNCLIELINEVVLNDYTGKSLEFHRCIFNNCTHNFCNSTATLNLKIYDCIVVGGLYSLNLYNPCTINNLLVISCNRPYLPYGTGGDFIMEKLYFSNSITADMYIRTEGQYTNNDYKLIDSFVTKSKIILYANNLSSVGENRVHLQTKMTVDCGISNINIKLYDKNNIIISDVNDLTNEPITYFKRTGTKVKDVPIVITDDEYEPFKIVITKATYQKLEISNITVVQFQPTIIRCELTRNKLCIDAVAITDCSGVGIADGKLEVTATGGDENYQYSINNIDYQVSNEFTGLLAGDYTVYVKDGEGTVANFEVTISQPIPEAYAEDVLTCDLTEESLDCDLAEEVLTCDFIE